MSKMIPPLPQTNEQLIPAPDHLNIDIYQCNIPEGTCVYNENMTLLGHKGIYSYRPTYRSPGAIELILPNGESIRYHSKVKYRVNDSIVVYGQGF